MMEYTLPRNKMKPIALPASPEHPTVDRKVVSYHFHYPDASADVRGLEQILLECRVEFFDKVTGKLAPPVKGRTGYKVTLAADNDWVHYLPGATQGKKWTPEEIADFKAI